MNVARAHPPLIGFYGLPLAKALLASSAMTHQPFASGGPLQFMAEVVRLMLRRFFALLGTLSGVDFEQKPRLPLARIIEPNPGNE